MSTDHDDIKFMQDPDRWPRWPMLPVCHKRKGFGDAQFCGFLLVKDFTRVHRDPTVYIGDIFAGPDPAKAEKITYESFEKLAEDWWVD